jgi:hypothetical protein
MGYYTDYDLTHDSPGLDDEICESLDELYMGASSAIHELFNCKWYEHEEHMLELSKQFPDTTFILYGTGEEQPDMWKKRFVNGQCDVVVAEIVFADFPPL